MTERARPPAGVVFDAFGTLFDLSSLRPRIDERLGEHGEAVFSGFTSRLVPYTWHLTASGRFLPMPEVAALALASAGREAGASLDTESARELAQGLTELSPYPDTPDALDGLASRRLAVLSNGTSDGIESLVGGAGLRDRFEHLLAAEAVERFKPAPEVYGLAMSAFGVDPSELLLVTAHEWDAAGAQAAGLRAALVTREGGPTGFLGREPDLVVDDLRELPAALERL